MSRLWTWERSQPLTMPPYLGGGGALVCLDLAASPCLRGQDSVSWCHFVLHTRLSLVLFVAAGPLLPGHCAGRSGHIALSGLVST